MPENNTTDREKRRADVIGMITSSREKAVEYLTMAGILDGSGQLAEVYRWKKIYLTDSKYLDELREAYDTLVKVLQDLQQDIPQNSGKTPDKLLRRLDCAVIEMAHVINEQSGDRAYDSVRGMFWEGQQLYPNAGFAEKNHIQICVRNPNCIKGFFIPRIIDRHFLNP